MLCLLRVLTCTVLDLVLVLNLVLVLTVDEASAETLVHVSDGADALLPCTYPEGRPAPNVSVYWKDKWDDQVLTIYNYTTDPKNQSPQYQNRVQSFPHLYKSGNFSLVLMKVNGSDGGVFECHIMPKGFQQNVRLNVTSKRESPGSGLAGSGLTESEEGRSGPSDGGSVAAPRLLLLLFHLPLLLSLCL